jgi:hypothetical protein
MKSLISVIYASRATEQFHEHEIPELLKQARLANARRELTGMLLYIGGSFLQVLEGQPDMVETVFASILLDTRHSQITLIARETIPERAYEGWTLLNKTLDPVEAGEMIGVTDYFTTATWVTQLEPDRAKKLLAAASVQWQIDHRSGKYRTLGRSA